MDENSRLWYDHLFDPLLEVCLIEPYEKFDEQLQATIGNDYDAWRKVILAAWNHTRSDLEQIELYITEDDFDSFCEDYRKSLQLGLRNEFIKFMHKRSIKAFAEMETVSAHERINVQLRYIDERLTNLQQASNRNTPNFDPNRILDDEGTLYQGMSRTLKRITKELAGKIVAKEQLDTARHQSRLIQATWLGTHQQLQHLNDRLVQEHCIRSRSGFMDFFNPDAALAPVVWQKKFTLLTYLLNELKRNSLISSGTSLKQFSGNFVKPSGRPWKSFHQASYNCRCNASEKPRHYSIIDDILNSLPQQITPG